MTTPTTTWLSRGAAGVACALVASMGATLPAAAGVTTVDGPTASAAAATSALADRLLVAPVIGSGSRLPAVPGLTVTWTAAGGPATVSGRRVTSGSEGTTTFTASWSDGTASGTKVFAVRVLPVASSTSVVSYTRRPTGSDQANQDVIARSMHLALGDDPDRAVPVNGGYGVLFGSAASVGLDRNDTRTLVEPSLYHRADGSYGVVATRARRDGSSDGTDASQVVVYTSRDLVRYSEPLLVDVGSTTGIRSPRAVHDVASNRDYLAWVDSSGQDRWASFTDLAVGGTRTATGVGAIDTGTAPPTAFEVGDSVPAGTLVVPDSTVSVMQGRFGRIRNTAVSVPPVSLAQGAVADLSSTRAGLTYSDGSTASRAVSWDPDDLAAVDTARPGSYTVRGTVRTPVYPVPFANNRADPDVYRYERNGTVQYLFMATDDTNNNNIASTHLPIRGSATIAGLSDTSGGASREVDLLNRVDGTAESNTQGKVFAGCYWAPELHEIGGKLSILFAPCFNADGKTNSGGDFRTVQAHIMQLRDGGNPLVPADWSKPAPILQSDGSPLQRSATLPGISLDMSYFEVNGKAYYTWSQRYIANNDYSDPATWIATVDPSNPTKVTSAITPIIQPVYSWEEQLSEGGFAVFHDGRVHLVYSSSGVSPTYVVGGASAPIGADLLDPASWTKENAPLQRSGPRGNTWFQSEQGPGHGAFTTDEDGNLLYVFHTWDDGGRDARLRRAHWAADGHLVLDMTLQEEVAPDLRRVSTTVVVRGTPGVTPGVTPGTTSSTTSATAAESSLTAPPRAASTIKVRQPVAGSSTRSRTARIVLRVPALSRPGGTLRITAGRTKRTVVVRGGTTAVSVPVRAGQRIVARYTGSATALPARTAQAASTGTTR